MRCLIKNEYGRQGLVTYISWCGEIIDPADDHKYTLSEYDCKCDECINNIGH